VTDLERNLTGGDAEVDRLLRKGLHVDAPSAEALARLQRVVESAWLSSVESRTRRWFSMAVAASLVLLTVIALRIFLYDSQSTSGQLAAHLVGFVAPGVTEEHMLERDTALSKGAVLRAGRSYNIVGQALIQLEDGGSLRVASGSEIEILAKDVVRLEHGEMYVDIPPGTHTNSAFTARTAAGEFRHVGTQFAIAVIQGETRLRVREGSVHWLVAGDESTVKAGVEVVFRNGTHPVERLIRTSGEDWNWIAATTPDFEIDNRPLEDFLVWVARESGRKLILADEQTRKQVSTIRMHGSVRGLTPMQALSAVMSATQLRYDLPDGQIRVSSAGHATQGT